jgi:hypothetical protein
MAQREDQWRKNFVRKLEMVLKDLEKAKEKIKKALEQRTKRGK